MYINKFRYELYDPRQDAAWEDLYKRKIEAGVHLTILPQNINRLDKSFYNLLRKGHYWLDTDGGRILYDFVIYHDPIKMIADGYLINLSEPTGRMIPKSLGFNAEPEYRLVDPLPAPPPGWVPEEVPELSRTQRAVEALRTGAASTQSEAARLFGITPAAVNVAAKREDLVSAAPVRSTLSRTQHALEALRTGAATTQSEAARMFGITPAAVNVAAKREGLVSAAPVRSTLSRTQRAVEALRTGAASTQSEAARLFGITPAAVNVAAKREGLVSAAPVRSTLSRTQRAVEALRTGAASTHEEAARRFGLSRATVTQAVGRARRGSNTLAGDSDTA